MFNYKVFFGEFISNDFMEKMKEKGVLRISYAKSILPLFVEKSLNWNRCNELVAIGRRSDRNMSRLLDFSQFDFIASCYPPYYKENLFDKDKIYLLPNTINHQTIMTVYE